MKRILSIILAVLIPILQSAAGPYIKIFGTLPNIALCYLVCYSLTNEGVRASVTGLILGLMMDILSGGTFGINSMLMMYFALIVSLFSRRFYWENKLASALAVFVCTFIYEAAYIMLVIFLGGKLPFWYSIIRFVSVEGALNALCSFVMVYLVKWLNNEYIRGI